MSKFTKEKLQQMLDLQLSFNVKINPEWKTVGYPYCDAIWTEAAEAFNHTAWEWWKNSTHTPDINQIKMELVDIWHFVMSELMTYEASEEMTHVGIVDMVNTDVSSMEIESLEFDIKNIAEAFKNIIRSAMLPRDEKRIGIILSTFIQALFVLKMDWADLYKLYVGKNTLNIFRQNNGYKTNTDAYKAQWAKPAGKEDNEYLTEILKYLDADNVDFQKDLLRELDNVFGWAKIQ